MRPLGYTPSMKLCFLLFAALLLVACDPKDPTPADPKPATPQASADSPQERLTQTLRKFSAEHQRVPTSLQDLVAAGYLSEIPSAPSGKKWSINPKRLTVELD